MLVIPAIDIKGGRCVRLLQGDPDKETVYAENPALMAQQFEKMGAKLIHVVDLDGAFNGKPVNKDIVAKISESVSIPIEIGGGIRSIETIEDYLSHGIKRIIIGTSALSEDFKVFIRKYPDNIIVGIDARDSMVATHGWKTSSDKLAMDLIKELQNFGIKEIIYTDIKTDGMLTGPNYDSIVNILNEVKGLSLIASGGIASIDDIIQLSEYTELGLKGCIVGKAIYEGNVDLEKAINYLQ